MKKNKDIERLFQEKFKQFESTPPADAWQNIHARLDHKKKKRRVLPLWLRNSGIAASLLLSGLIGYQLKSNSITGDIKENNVVITTNESTTTNNTTETDNLNSGDNPTLNKDFQIETNELVVEADSKSNSEFIQNNESGNTNAVVLQQSNSDKTTSTVNKTSVGANPKKESNTIKQLSDKNVNSEMVILDKNKTPFNSNDVIASAKNTSNQTDNSFEKEISKENSLVNQTNEKSSLLDKGNIDSQLSTISRENNSNSEGIVSNDLDTQKNNSSLYQTSKVNGLVNQDKEGSSLLEKNNIEKQLNSINKENNSNLNGPFSETNSAVIVNNEFDTQRKNSLVNETSKENSIASQEKEKTNLIKKSDVNSQLNTSIKGNNSNNNKNLQVVTISENEIVTDKDSTNVVVADASAANPLELLLKQIEEGKNVDEKEELKRNKWAVSSIASPVYFNSFNNASALDQSYESNSKEYLNSMSYGIGVAYNISKKLTIKTGLNTLNSSTNTNDVVFFQDSNAKTSLTNVDLNTMGEVLTIQSRSSSVISEVNNSIDVNGAPMSTFEGKINEQLDFLEIPLELDYKLLDKKFDISLVGGFSTLFLQDNKILLQTENASMEIGKANNVNNVQFTSNFGIGMHYSFWKSFTANLQPTFKYQLNAFTGDTNTKPYFIGLNSGVSYSF